MAIDTRSKRFSMINMASGMDGCGIHTLFEADGTVDADDRASLLDLYNGNALDAPVVEAHHRIGWGGGFVKSS